MLNGFFSNVSREMNVIVSFFFLVVPLEGYYYVFATPLLFLYSVTLSVLHIARIRVSLFSKNF